MGERTPPLASCSAQENGPYTRQDLQKAPRGATGLAERRQGKFGLRVYKDGWKLLVRDSGEGRGAWGGTCGRRPGLGHRCQPGSRECREGSGGGGEDEASARSPAPKLCQPQAPRRRRRWGPAAPPVTGSGEGGRGARARHLPAVPGGSPRRGLVHRRLHLSTSRRDCCSAAAAAAAALRAGSEPGSRLRPAPAGRRAREHRAALSSPAPPGGRAAAAGPSRLARVSCQPAVSPGSAAPPPPLLPPPLPHPRPPGEPPPRRDHRPRRLSSPRRRRRPPHATGPARLGPRRACSRPPPGRRSPQPTIHRGSAGAGGPRPDRESPRGSDRAWRGRRGAGVPRAGTTPRGCPAPPPVVLVKAEVLWDLRSGSHRPPRAQVVQRSRALPSAFPGERAGADPSPPRPTDSRPLTPTKALASACPGSLSPS
ncbi:basic proline-rich protein-like [Mus pahari]|uniref:basic proline-rich protein-like n=1 Tax=Mus pahari TaxID=10093 RepID=UPI000A313A1F|nr:basic proline-rich protein-like [Mus pahari]